MVSSLRSVASESAYTVLIGVMMSRVFFLLKSRAPLMIVTLTVTSVHTGVCIHTTETHGFTIRGGECVVYVLRWCVCHTPFTSCNTIDYNVSHVPHPGGGPPPPRALHSPPPLPPRKYGSLPCEVQSPPSARTGGTSYLEKEGRNTRKKYNEGMCKVSKCVFEYE